MGRPRVDAIPITVRVHPPQLAALDKLIADQPEPRPGRPEIIRLALADYLLAKGYLPVASKQG